MMNQKQRILLSLYLIISGSLILAIPASWGTLVLIDAAIRPLNGEFDNIVLFLPIALVGYFLLFGYIWTAWTKRFVKWFWLISMIYNGAATVLSLLFIASILFFRGKIYEAQFFPNLLVCLFSTWTFYITITSAKYALNPPNIAESNLP